MRLVAAIAVAVLAAAALLTGEAVWLDLPGEGTKCVAEDIRSNVVVMADYYVIHEEEHVAGNAALPAISVKVTSPFGRSLHHEEKVTHGQFAFTTTESGDHLVCFWMATPTTTTSHNKAATVGIDIKVGIAAKDWDSIAKKEKTQGLELELMKLEGLVQAIHENLAYLKIREGEMREVSERTNERVAWFSILSLALCILISLLQTCHIKRFFRNKKLL
ncbi:unnamed protein product [Cuscuta campestris]|uniref:GOLD domain-containing protein n=2 Tax=Cuscuta sect. Cleistogrammica TaxID=1824901 RepID=A0A484MNI7_9ASTE|nr:hypothetical protein DM860_013694 [Cuscuta australis]VFQ90541.1 unnamed protein product [Cuscuta campestris]